MGLSVVKGVAETEGKEDGEEFGGDVGVHVCHCHCRRCCYCSRLSRRQQRPDHGQTRRVGGGRVTSNNLSTHKRLSCLSQHCISQLKSGSLFKSLNFMSLTRISSAGNLPHLSTVLLAAGSHDSFCYTHHPKRLRNAPLPLHQVLQGDPIEHIIFGDSVSTNHL